MVRLGNRRTAKPTTYDGIVAKYVKLGYRPLSAKAQADDWLRIKNQRAAKS